MTKIEEQAVTAYLQRASFMLLQNMARTNIATNASVKLRRLGIVFGDLCEARTLLDKEDASEESG